MKERKVLVVDDFPPFCGLISRLALKRGHRCLATGKGREAVRLARQERPDVILLDLALPELNGFEVLKMLREDAFTRDIPVLVATGQADDDDLLEAASLGLRADDFIHKGQGNDAIMDRLEAVLARRPVCPSALTPALECGRLRLDVVRREVWREGRKLPVRGPIQFEFLRALASKPRGLSVEDLLARVWRGKAAPKTVAKTVQRLRQVLHDDIVAIPGGYRLVG